MVSRRRRLIRHVRLRRLVLRGALLLLAAAVLGALALFLWPSLAEMQSDLSLLHDRIEDARDWRDRNTALALILFVGAFCFASIVPVPIIAALTLAGGAFFGFWLGFLLSLAGSVAGATLAFLIARHGLNRRIRRWLGQRARQIDETVRRNGALALLSLRLTPALPFFLLNIAAGVSSMSLRTFVGVTALGVMPNKAILSGAGTQLAEIQQITDIFGPRLVLILIALAVTPWIARWIARRIAGPAPL